MNEPETRRIKRLEVSALFAAASLIFSGGMAYSQLANAQDNIRDLRVAHDHDLETIAQLEVQIARIDANVQTLVKQSDENNARP